MALSPFRGTVACSEHVQFLGVIVDEHLSWKPHLEAVCTKVSRGVGVICRLRFILPEKVLITLYNSIVLPYLTFFVLRGVIHLGHTLIN